ncbi:MAG: glutamate-cysteine ligase family protein [Silvanigrellaceae bacterium]
MVADKFKQKSKSSLNANSDNRDNNVCDGLWKRPIRGNQQLTAVSSNSHYSSARLSGVANIGIEMEMFAYDAHTLIPLGLPGSVFHPSELLKRMSDAIEGAKLKVDPATGVVVGLSMPSGANFSLEPGGQVEFSSAPRSDTRSLVEDVVFGLEALRDAAGDAVVFLSHGTNPLAPRDMPLLVPKERYQILRRYFQSEAGGRGVDMMGHTGTVQPNIDVPGDDSDWEDAVRLSFALTPAVQALTRNSFYFAGERSKFKSERQQIWKQTDKTRAGIPEGIVQAQDVACHYASWARKANVFLVRGLPVAEQPLHGELTFEQFLHTGYKDCKATLQDWELHLATLFPEIRLRGFLEIRNLDAQPFEHLLAGVMLWKGILIDPNARAEAWSLLSRNALATDENQQSAELVLGRELLVLATESLRRMGDTIGVAALESAAVSWLLASKEELHPQDPFEFVRKFSVADPAAAFSSSLDKAGVAKRNTRDKKGLNGKKI